MGMTRSADYYSPLPGCERIASTDRSARSTANRSTIDTRNSHTIPTSSLPSSSSSSSPSSIGSPSALLSPSSPSSSSSSSSLSFLRHRQEGGGRGLLLDPLPLHGGETKRAELPEVVLTEVAQLVGHPSTARVLLHNTNKSSYTHLPLPSFSTALSSTASTGNSTASTGNSTGFTAEIRPASSSSTSTSTTSSIISSRMEDEKAEIRQCKSNGHSGSVNGRPAHLVSLSSSGTELHHVGTRHSSHIPLPLSRTPSPLEEREGSSKFGLSDSYSPDCSPPGSPNLNQNRRLSEPCSSLSPLPSPRTSQNMSLSQSATIDLTAEEESNDNQESKTSSSHSIGFICNNNNMDISSDSDSSPSMSTKNNHNNNNSHSNRPAAPQPNENVRGGYFLTVISGGSLPGETESRQTIRVGPGPWKVAVVPVCPIARARLLRRRALLAARFGNTGGNPSPPSAEQQERESRPEHNSRSLPQKQQQIQSHHHHHRHYHHYHNQPSHHPQCQHHQNALCQQHQHQHQHHQQQQNVQRSPMAKRSSLSQVQSLRLPSRHNSGVPPVVQNIKSLSRSREIELKKSLLLQRQRLSQSGTLEVLANAVTDLNMHESKLS